MCRHTGSGMQLACLPDPKSCPPKGKLVDTGFQDFCPATEYSVHSALDYTKGIARSSCGKLCLSLHRVNRSSSSGFSFLFLPLESCPRQTRMCLARCADMTLVQHHQQCAIKTPWPLCLSLCKILSSLDSSSF